MSWIEVTKAWAVVAGRANRTACRMYLNCLLSEHRVLSQLLRVKSAYHALRDPRGPSESVTTWAGGTNAWQLTDWTVLSGARDCVTCWLMATNLATKRCLHLAWTS